MVYDEPADKPYGDAADGGNGDGGCGLAERNAADEYDGFEAFTEDGDAREEEEDPFAGLGAAVSACSMREMVLMTQDDMCRLPFPLKARSSFTRHLALAGRRLSVVRER